MYRTTPDTDPDRFTDYEAAIFYDGLCCWQTGYGLPWMEYCKQPSDPDADFGYCYEHDEEASELWEA